jgi:hypothetical protein
MSHVLYSEFYGSPPETKVCESNQHEEADPYRFVEVQQSVIFRRHQGDEREF